MIIVRNINSTSSFFCKEWVRLGMESKSSRVTTISNIFLGACVGAAVVIVAFQVFGIGKDAPEDVRALNAFLSIPGIEEFMINMSNKTISGVNDGGYRVLVYYNQPCESCTDADFLQYIDQISQEKNNIRAMAFVHPDESENDIKNIKVNYGIEIGIASLPKEFKDEINKSTYYGYFNGLIFIMRDGKIVSRHHFGKLGLEKSIALINGL